jgi:hypothetical protein
VTFYVTVSGNFVLLIVAKFEKVRRLYLRDRGDGNVAERPHFPSGL